MEKLLEFLNQISERFTDLSQGKKVAFLALIGVGLGSLFAMSLWIQEPDYQLLYANLSQQDAAAIVDHLKTQKTPYELANQGGTIRVPANQVHEIRLQMASQGLPEGSEVGLEIFEKSSLGMTDFIQKLNYQRALQGELARTIKSLDAVDSARVHLVIPKETLFIREKPEGKASVMIKVKPGRTLTEIQIQGIVHLISASVEGINASNVVVVDFKGNLLSGAKEGSQAAMLSATNYAHKRRVEKELEENILRMLEEALGKGTVIARVTADLDFEKVDRTEEIYDPDSQVVRSEQSATEATVGAVPPGGVTGVQTLVPQADTTQGGTSGQPASRNKANQVLNYEINKVVRQVSKPLGDIAKLSVAVMIDGSYTGSPPAYQARTPEDIAKYLQIVQSAVGYNADRGDQIQVENVQFDRSLLQEQQSKLAQAEQIDLAFEVAKYLLGAILVMLFFTRIIRPITNWMTTSVEVVAEAGALSSGEMQAIEEEKRRIGDMGAEAAEIRKSVGEFVTSDPKYTAGVVRRWMKDRSALK